ncbi:MAG: hypothetical protein WBA41_21215 [Rivularia sp. (in: cyanobacteria)]
MKGWLQVPRLPPVVIIGLVAVVCATQVIEDLYQSGELSTSKG